MGQFIHNFFDFLVNLLASLGPIIGILIIILESIIPILPLGAFIALNMLAFGTFFGFFISWLATCFGCILSYYIFKKGFSDKLYNNIKENGKTKKILNVIKKLSFSKLVLLMAMPFTPAFLVNITAGLSQMNFTKFVCAVLLSKIFIIYFWGYVGTSIIESVTDVITLLRIFGLLIIAYFISKLIQKKINIRE